MRVLSHAPAVLAVKTWRFILCLAFLFRAASGAELRDLKVLYVGNTNSPRAAEFKAFLSTNLAACALAPRSSFDPAMAKNFDVVLLDWPQSESRGAFPPRQSPLGERNTWTTPTVLLGSAGLHMAIVWDVDGGFG